MKTDRELLELAAKACGEITLSWYGNQDYFDGVLSRWNPLTDDGDALRLAVKLQMKIYVGEAYPWDASIADYSHQYSGCVDEDEQPDPLKATRRAITIAAAAIGEIM